MKDKFFKLGYMMMLWWTFGQMMATAHSRNVINTICCGIATAIWLGIHTDIINYFKALYRKGKA